MGPTNWAKAGFTSANEENCFILRRTGRCCVREHRHPARLTHHLRHNRVLHERVLLIASINTDEPRVEPEQRIRLVPVGIGITRVLLHFGFMETPNVMEGLSSPASSLNLAASILTTSPFSGG